MAMTLVEYTNNAMSNRTRGSPELVSLTCPMSIFNRGCDRMVVDLQPPMQSMHITTEVVSSNLVQSRCTRCIM